MDVQDFLVQGEGREEDKREAWELFQRAYQRQMKGELEEAVSLYRQSIAAHPTAEAHTFLGWTYSFMGRLDDAIPWFQKAMHAKRYESPAFPHLNLGRVYEKKGNWTEAIASYKQALALNPDYVLAKKSLGRLVSMLN